MIKPLKFRNKIHGRTWRYEKAMDKKYLLYTSTPNHVGPPTGTVYYRSEVKKLRDYLTKLLRSK